MAATLLRINCNMIRYAFAVKSQNHADSTAIQFRISCDSVANCFLPLQLEITFLSFLHKMSSEEAILQAEEEMIALVTAALC